MSNWIKKFLDKLAKANAETFQGKKLDCCDLNKQSNNEGLKPKNKVPD